jgi:protein O-GlcNAc transferase
MGGQKADHRADKRRLISEALRRHRCGNFEGAEQLYKQILALDPRNADSLHLLGLIALRCGRHLEAAELIGKAVRLQGNNPSYL